MGLIRLVIFALVIWLLWRMIRNYQAGLKSRKPSDSNRKLGSHNMVSCHYCRVHVPENRAVAHDSLWFCSEDHKAKFLDGRD